MVYYAVAYWWWCKKSYYHCAVNRCTDACFRSQSHLLQSQERQCHFCYILHYKLCSSNCQNYARQLWGSRGDDNQHTRGDSMPKYCRWSDREGSLTTFFLFSLFNPTCIIKNEKSICMFFFIIQLHGAIECVFMFFFNYLFTLAQHYSLRSL